jgi:hypothetical protein
MGCRSTAIQMQKIPKGLCELLQLQSIGIQELRERFRPN